MGGRGASSGSTRIEKGIYKKLISDARIERELIDSVKAQKYDNPDAKIGDTIIDSSGMIARFADKISVAEYNILDWNKAEKELFKKLKQIEKNYGFKK